MASVSESLPPQADSDPWTPWLNRAETVMRTATHTGILAPTGYTADFIESKVFAPSEDQLAQERQLPDAAVANNMLRQKGMLPGPISPGTGRDGTVWAPQGQPGTQAPVGPQAGVPSSVAPYLASAPSPTGITEDNSGLAKWGGSGIIRTMEDGSTATTHVYEPKNSIQEWSQYVQQGSEALAAKRRELKMAGFYPKDAVINYGSGIIDEQDANAMWQAMYLANLNSIAYEDVVAPRVQWSMSNGGKPYTGEDPNDPEVQGKQREQAVRFSADFESNAAALRKFAWDNGLSFTDDFIGRKAQAIALGEDTLDNVVGVMRTHVSKAFPGFAEQVQSGYSVRDLADPYLSLASQVLEVNPNDLSLTDPLVQKALQGTGQGDSGMPLWKFEELARQDKRWQYTDNARNQIVGGMMELGRLMGFEG